MTLSGLNITIVGAGIGGLSAALALLRKGAQVTILEQSAAITEVGAGLQLSPNAMVVLNALGVGEALEANSVQADAVELRDFRRSRLVSRLDLSSADGRSGYCFVHRADLIDVLAEATRAAGAKVRLLQKVEKILPGDTPVLEMAQDARLQSDLVVGADGLHSKLRFALNGTTAPFFTRQVAWRATVPNDVNHPDVARVHMGPGKHLVTYPLREGRILNLVGVQETPVWTEEGWQIDDDPENLRAAFSEFGGEAKAALDLVTKVRRWGLFRHPVARTWHGGNTALLGDAAHPTLPFMAQGAAMAIEDAWVLADALSGAKDIASGLQAYQQRRETRVQKVVEAASRNAWKYHLRFGPLRQAAHVAMRTGSVLAPRRMIGQFDWLYHYDVTASENDRVV